MSSRVPFVPIAVTLIVLVAAIAGALVAFQPQTILSNLAVSPIPRSAAAFATAVASSAGPVPTAAPSASVAPSASAGASAAPSASVSVAPSAAVPAGPSVAPSASAAPSAPASAFPSPSPTPKPSPILVPAPLTGVLVPPSVAARHAIAVMIDDLAPARPQSGFSAASVIWQAPAEGGIPRYMLLFQDGVPGDVGPVRSARYYFIGWAAEWRAAYAHAGGSPQALTTLRLQGRGQLVYNVDEFAYSSFYFWRISSKFAPHNLYTNGQRLRQMANGTGATSAATPPRPAWTFGSETALADRPTGGIITADYSANHIRYTYDRTTNSYPRWVSPGVKQIDASTGKRVAPKNVVIMFVRFGALNDSQPEKGRLEADFIGSGKAYVSTNGRTVAARWIKKSLTAPTQFVDAKGAPIALTPGQTVVQVMPTGAHVTIADGKVPAKHSSAGHTARPE